MKNRTILTGDNLIAMRKMADNSIDLIYLDPPFNKNNTFTASIGSLADGASFIDKWNSTNYEDHLLDEILHVNIALHEIIKASEYSYDKTMRSYLTHMGIRLLEMRRILKRTGSIYYHCDYTSSHYIKLMLDSVFGHKRFQNEIIWNYKWASNMKKRFARKHDTIFFYSKSDDYIFNMDEVREPYTEEQLKGYRKDENGYYTLDSKKKKKWYANPLGQTPGSVFDIGIIARKGKERTGYPTQKPLKLLERIIKASSNSGDIVLDPFCGSGTTCVAAESLNRQWIAIDIQQKAANVLKARLDANFGADCEYTHRAEF